MNKTNPKHKTSNGQDFSMKAPLTEQSHAEGCDIRNILRRAQATGQMPHYGGDFKDLPNVPTFHEAQNLLATASQTFDSLPLQIRQKMNHSPVEFLQFITDPKQREAMEKLGLNTDHLPTPPEAPREPATPTPVPTPTSAIPEE